MIAVINYNAGNAPSVLNAFNKINADAKLIADPSGLSGAAAAVLPGVGSAKATVDDLAQSGFDAALREFVLGRGKPFLGVCIGQQILFEQSAEDGGVKTLGFLKGEVVKFPPSVRIPHIGWNEVKFRPHPLTAGINGAHFYFVNSYYAVPCDKGVVLGECGYGVDFCAAVVSGNIAATQFHLEKSGAAGLKMLKNFVEWADAYK